MANIWNRIDDNEKRGKFVIKYKYIHFLRVNYEKFLSKIVFTNFSFFPILKRKSQRNS